MTTPVSAVLCVLGSYLIGCINPAYIIGRARGFDIRKQGSGNAGASNAFITMGKLAGLFSALFDILKAWLAVHFAPMLFPALPLAREAAGVSCILGHMFPVFMKGRGGKGLACLGGMILAFDWRFFLILLGVELVVVLVTNYICFVPTTASVIFAVYYVIRTEQWVGAALLFFAAAVILIRHLGNFKRIRLGTEAHFSMLWNRRAETERIARNRDKHGL